jgi:hypothetical protein
MAWLRVMLPPPSSTPTHTVSAQKCKERQSRPTQAESHAHFAAERPHQDEALPLLLLVLLPLLCHLPPPPPPCRPGDAYVRGSIIGKCPVFVVVWMCYVRLE